jgi:DNA-directed RNA polymerase subunit RPC12/RpoP
MIVFPCHVCRTSLQVEDEQAGQLVRCPNCMTALRVPAQQARQASNVAVGAGASGGARSGAERRTDYAPPPSPPPGPRVTLPPNIGQRVGPGKRYGFNCPYCSSRLEATESMAAQEGQCPTCGNTIVIPILDRYGRLIDPITKEIIKQDPHPVHAYAAAGDRAPRILRQTSGSQSIQCPRCSSVSPITANNCKSCGMPFTMEGTTLEAAGGNNPWCVASLVLGIIALPTCFLFVPGALAIIFGAIGYNQVASTDADGTGGGKGMAVAGMVCGGISLLAFLYYIMN